jgi:hypothetical protein
MEACMSRSLVSHALTTFADDALYHLTGLAQGAFDLATVVAFGLAIAVSTTHPAPLTAPAALALPQVASNCAMALLADSCITAEILRPADS